MAASGICAVDSRSNKAPRIELLVPEDDRSALWKLIYTVSLASIQGILRAIPEALQSTERLAVIL